MADKAVEFVQSFCTHVKGSFTGRPFLLDAWQAEIVREAFGRKTLLGKRRYKHIWIEAPRKSGKTTFAAAIAVYMLLVDNESDAEAYIFGPSASRARLCMNIMKMMIDNDEDMRSVCAVRANQIHYKDSSIALGSASVMSISGSNVSFAVLDDVQEIISKEGYETLVACSAAREEPLFLYLAAAGGGCSFASEMHEYAVGVATGNILDQAWLVRIFAADPKDDWTDPEVWKKAHPGLGRSISQRFVREQCLRALHNPGYIELFRRIYLNVWTDQIGAWLDMGSWDQCAFELDEHKFAGRTCRIGLDLSTTTDLTALVVVFREVNDGYTIFSLPFCPGETIRKRTQVDRVDYELWRDQGFLVATEGNVVDYSVVRDTIERLCEAYDVREVAYDQWGSSMLISQLIERGIRCTPVNQDASTMSRPVDELERVLREGTLRHDGNPVLRWCASNVILARTASGFAKPSKRRSRDRIDLIISALMAISRFVASPDISTGGDCTSA
ncbi:MAG: terminase large subunit [Rhodospirillales bacterium]|nr:terminase large subunit [Rhodospirillales bacterium]